VAATKRGETAVARSISVLQTWDLMSSNIKLGLVITAVNFEALEYMW
jgi:hypothetical protein